MKEKMFSSKEEIKEKGVGEVLMSLLFLISLIILRGAIVSILWNHVMPVIFNLPKIGVGQAILLSLLISFVATDFSTTKD